MKTQEQQKAELLTQYVEALIPLSTTVEINDMEIVLIRKYNEIIQQKPLTADPYADEVFSGRVLRLIHSTCGYNSLTRISNLPHIEWFRSKIGFGRKSREEYIEVMTTYEMWDKI
tara:strand:+ start:2707 stop:3051 length:345 start_codon:yes stop_codon:yes gene_type:complete